MASPWETVKATVCSGRGSGRVLGEAVSRSMSWSRSTPWSTCSSDRGTVVERRGLPVHGASSASTSTTWPLVTGSPSSWGPVGFRSDRRRTAATTQAAAAASTSQKAGFL